jgi:hypothetical protein
MLFLEKLQIIEWMLTLLIIFRYIPIASRYFLRKSSYGKLRGYLEGREMPRWFLWITSYTLYEWISYKPLMLSLFPTLTLLFFLPHIWSSPHWLFFYIIIIIQLQNTITTMTEMRNINNSFYLPTRTKNAHNWFWNSGILRIRYFSGYWRYDWLFKRQIHKFWNEFEW